MTKKKQTKYTGFLGITKAPIKTDWKLQQAKFFPTSTRNYWSQIGASWLSPWKIWAIWTPRCQSLNLRINKIQNSQKQLNFHVSSPKNAIKF